MRITPWEDQNIIILGRTEALAPTILSRVRNLKERRKLSSLRLHDTIDGHDTTTSLHSTIDMEVSRHDSIACMPFGANVENRMRQAIEIEQRVSSVKSRLKSRIKRCANPLGGHAIANSVPTVVPTSRCRNQFLPLFQVSPT